MGGAAVGIGDVYLPKARNKKAKRRDKMSEIRNRQKERNAEKKNVTPPSLTKGPITPATRSASQL